MSNQFGLCSSVGKSLGISPQNVKMTSLGINPHVNLAVIPGHPPDMYFFAEYVFFPDMYFSRHVKEKKSVSYRL